MGDEGRIAFSSELDEKGFAEGAKNIKRQVHEITTTVEQSGEKMDSVFDKVGKNIANAFAIGSLLAFQKKIIEVRGEMESLQISFETLAGERIGKQLYEDIKQFATSTPMMMKDLAKGAQTLLGFNIEAKKIMPILRQIGDISMGDSQKFNSLSLAFAQMSSTGKLMGQDLLQMINAGFNPLVQIAEKTGKTVAELKEEMSQGKITVEMVEDAFKAATEEGGKFNGMLEKQSQGMAGAISNLKGAYEDMLNDIGSKQQGILVDGINLVTDILKHYETFAKVLLSVIAAYGSYKAVLLLTAAAQKAMNLIDSVRLMMMYRKELGLATAAQQAFNTAVKANPVGLLIGAVSGIIAALTMFTGKTKESTEALDRLRDASMGEMQKLQTYRAVLENVSKTSNQYKNTLRDLNAMAEEYHVTLFTENDTVDELTKKYDELTEAIRASAAERLLSEATSKSISDSMKKEKDAMDKLIDEASDSYYKKFSEYIGEYAKFASENLRNVTLASWSEISKMVMEQKDRIVEVATEGLGEDWAAGIVHSQIKQMLRSLGVTVEEIEGFESEIEEYSKAVVKGFVDAENELKRTKAQLEGFARTATETKDITNDAIDGMNYEQLQDELAKVQKEIDKVNDKTINPDVDTSRLKVLEDMLQRIRDLMPGQLTEGSDSALEKRLRKLKEERDSYTFGSAEWNSRNEDIKTLSATLNAHKKNYAENSEKTSKAGETATHRAAQLRRQREAYLVEQSAQARELERGEFDLWSQTEKAAIDAMHEGTARNIRQIELDFAERKEELRRQQEDLRREKWEADKRLWESNPDNKDKPFAGLLTDSKYDTTQLEREMYAKQEEYARQTYERRKEQEKAANQQAIDEYLRQWGDYSQKREAIERKSARQIAYLEKELQQETDEEAKAAVQARIDAAKAGKEKEIDQLDEQYGKAKQFMIDLFGDASEKSVAEIDKIIKKYEALVKFLNGDGSVTREQLVNSFGFTDAEIDKVLSKLDHGEITVKEFTDALKGLNGELGQRSPWASFLGGITKGIEKIKSAKGDIKKIGSGIEQIGSAVKDYSPQLRQFSSDIATIFGQDDSKLQDAIQGIEGLGMAAQGVGQVMSGDVVGGISSFVNGVAQVVDALDGMFGADYSSYNSLVAQYDRLAEVWETLIDRKSEYINMSYGTETIRVGREALELVEKQAEAFRELGRARLNAGASAGSHSIGRRMAKATSSADWQAIAQSLGMSVSGAQNLIGTSRMTGLFDLTAEQLRSLQEDNQVWWANMDEDVRKYLESIISNEEKWKAVHEQMMEQLTSTTKEDVFSGFLDSLYDIANGSEDVFDDIAKNWQEMVNRIVVNNLVAGKFKDRLDAWYDKLYNINRQRSEGIISDMEYQRQLNGLQEEYNRHVADAQEELELLTKNGIIKPIEEATEETLINLDTIRDGWMSMLMDMSADTEDWANDIAKMMTEALISMNIFDDEWEKTQQDWINRYNEALHDQSLSDAQRKAILKGLQNEQEAWVEENRRKAKEIYEMTGYGSEQSEQSATVQAMERITVDQADELIGRMNAGQMIWEQHKDVAVQIQQNIAAMQDVVRAGTNGINSLVSLAQTRNQHLNNILSACQGIRNDMMEHLDKLNNIERKI